MNIIPPNHYNRPVPQLKQGTKRLDNTDNRNRKNVQTNRRTLAERRRKSLPFHDSIDMRQAGDRRKSNRLIVTT